MKRRRSDNSKDKERRLKRIRLEDGITPTIELPDDIWSVIISLLFERDDGSLDYTVAHTAVFISWVSKRLHRLWCQHARLVSHTFGLDVKLLSPEIFIDRVSREEGVNCVKYLHQIGYPLDEQVAINAMFRANLQLLKYYHEQGGKFSNLCVEVAAYIGQMEALQYMHSVGGMCSSHSCHVD